ncbi:hypothetical protein AMECASPLE_021819, partial [Ameca splendens]
LNWVCGVFYSLLNICTSACLGSSGALSLINSIFTEKWMKNKPLCRVSSVPLVRLLLIRMSLFPGFLSLIPKPRRHRCFSL